MNGEDVSEPSGEETGGMVNEAAAVPSIDSPAGTLLERRTLRARLAARGVEVYGDLLDVLSNEISPAEADEARVAFRRSMKALAWVTLGLLVFAALPFQAEWSSDLLLAATLVAALVLVSAYQVPFAGRVILAPAFLLTLRSSALGQVDLSTEVGQSLLSLLLGLGLGALIDVGASRDPERRHPRLRRGLLAGTGVLISLTAGSSQFWITCAAGLAVCLWSWWPARWLDRRSHLGREDAETIRMLAMKRWAFAGWGRFVAVTLSLVPFLLFLHNIGLSDHLQWPDDDRALVKTSIGDRGSLWYWPSHAAYLRVSDLTEEQFYGVPKAQLGGIEPLMEKLKAASGGKDEYARLTAALKEHRLDSLSRFEAFQERTDEKKLFHLEEPPLESSSGAPGQYRIEDLSAGSETALSPMERKDIADLLGHNAVWQWLLLGYGLLGFTILWRRGGDSRQGWWIGLWVVTVGGLGSFRYSSFFLAAFNYRVLGRAELPAEILLCTILNLLVMAALLASILFMLFVPCAAIWTHACWPTLRDDGTRLKRDRLITAAKIAWVSCCMSFAFYLPFTLAMEEVLEAAWAAVLAIAAFVAASLVFGFLFRRRKSLRERQPEISVTAGLLLFLVQGVVAASVLAEFLVEDLTLARTLTMSSLVVGFGFLLFITVLIFRKDFLYLSAARDFSFAIAALIPVLVAWSEEFSSSVANRLTVGLIPERGNEIVAVVLAVGLLPPIRSWLERRLQYLSQSGLAATESRIHSTLEELPDLWSPESLAGIRDLLEKIGLSGVRLCVRSGRDQFAIMGKGKSIEVSPPLRKFLVDREGFLDLSRLAFEWSYFFVQFELHRLRKATDGRFLLPIVVGGSLRALLLIPENTSQRRLGETLASEIAKLGLITALFRSDDPPEADG